MSVTTVRQQPEAVSFGDIIRAPRGGRAQEGAGAR